MSETGMNRKKAPNGSGSVYQLGTTGRYRAAVTMPDGKTVERTRSSKPEAQVALRELLAQRDAGILRTTSRQTVAAYLDQWLTVTRRGDLRPHTEDTYRSSLKRAVVTIGGIQLGRLTVTHVSDVRAGMLEAGYAPATVNATLRTLRTALNTAVDHGLILRNPALKVRFVPKSPRDERIVSADHMAALLRHSEGSRWHALWMVLLGTGLRIGEALALRWDDIDGDTLRVRHTVTTSSRRPGPFLGPPKTKTSRRDVVMPQPVRDALAAHRPIVRRYQLLASRWDDHGLVFAGRWGGYMRTQTARNHLRRDLEAIGAPVLALHQLRHTFATHHLILGTRLEVVQEQLGHASIRMTADLYSHVPLDMHEEAAARLGALLDGTRRA